MITLSRRACVGGLAGVIAACGNPASKVAAREPKVRPNLYQCEGCEGVYETDFASLRPQTRIGPPDEPGQPLQVIGSVFEVDGLTPAAGVVIYAYQTNSEGLYANGSNASEWSRRHGRLRGWLKTGSDGTYRFDTIKPAPYPNDTLPAHIHFTVLEPGRQPYWIDDIVFDGEFGVTEAYRRRMVNQGGNGIVRLGRDTGGTLLVRRDIVLERHSN